MKKLGLFICAALSLFLVTSPAYSTIGGVKVYPVRFDFNAKCGETKTANVTVVNQRKKTITLEIEKKDYYLTSKVFDVDPGTVKRGCANLLAISPQRFHLQPGEQTTVRITITMPEKCDGTYWTRIYLNDVSKNYSVKKDQGKGRIVQIFLEYSWEIRIFETVPGTEISGGRVSNVQISPATAEKPLNMSIEFENIGNTILKCTGWIEFRDESGETVEKVELKKFSSYPDAKRIKETEIPPLLKPGEYSALAVIDYGGESLVAGETFFEIR